MLSNKKLLLAVTLGGFLGWQILHESGDILLAQAFAQNAAAGFTAPPDFQINGILSFLSLFFNFGVFLIYLFLMILSKLIDPNTIFEFNNIGGPGGMQPLLEIWKISRNIVNVFFAFALIGVAIYTTVRGDRSTLTSHIGKFVIAVILVNFSWFFPRVILDVANVLTATVYSLPADINIQQCIVREEVRDGNGGLAAPNDFPCRYITAYHLFPEPDNKCLNDAIAQQGNNFGNKSNYLILGTFICVETSELPAEANTGLGILHGLFLNHSRIFFLGQIHADDLPAGGVNGVLEQVGSFTISFLLTFIFMIGSLFPLAAMLVAFFIRIPVIWLTTAFMPFMFVGYIMGEKMSVGGGNFNSMKIFEHFVKAAFLPTIVAIPMTIGYIMITIGTQAGCPPGQAFGVLCQPINIPLHGIRTVWSIIWYILALMIMWVGVFEAMKMDEIYSKATDGIRATGKSWAKFGSSLPFKTPLPILGNANSIASGGGGALMAALKNPEAAFVRDGKFNPDIAGNLKKNSGADPSSTNPIPDSRKKELVRKSNDAPVIKAIDNIVNELNAGKSIDAVDHRELVRVLRDNGVSHNSPEEIRFVLDQHHAFKNVANKPYVIEQLIKKYQADPSANPTTPPAGGTPPSSPPPSKP